MKKTFKKKERLHSRKLIDTLFSEGKHFFKYPFKVIWLETTHETAYPVQIMVSVSKRKFRKAVDRNKLKRRIKEAYRNNKPALVAGRESKKEALLLALVYTADDMLSYAEIERKIILILQRLTEQDDQAAG